jgi:hypothetical protein
MLRTRQPLMAVLIVQSHAQEPDQFRLFLFLLVGHWFTLAVAKTLGCHKQHYTGEEWGGSIGKELPLAA